MIAAELGVTVAAVYHQFHTKDEIIRAAAESELLKLQAVVEGAESQATTELAREALITGMVDLTLGVGRSVSAVLSDPVVTAPFRRNPQLRDLVHRMGRLLTDESTTREARIRTAILIAAINGVATHPFVADIDDEALRSELLYLGHQLLSR
jgi:AcrR family transcriptional regulator